MKKKLLTVAVVAGLLLSAGAAVAAVNFRYAKETAKVVYQIGDPVTVALNVTNTTSTQQTYSIEAYQYGYCPGTIVGGVLTGQGSVTLPIEGYPQSVTLGANQTQTLTVRTPALDPVNTSCGQISGNAWTIFSYVHAADGTVQANTSAGYTVAQ